MCKLAKNLSSTFEQPSKCTELTAMPRFQIVFIFALPCTIRVATDNLHSHTEHTPFKVTTVSKEKYLCSFQKRNQCFSLLLNVNSQQVGNKLKVVGYKFLDPEKVVEVFSSWTVSPLCSTSVDTQQEMGCRCGVYFTCHIKHSQCTRKVFSLHQNLREIGTSTGNSKN